MGNQQNYGKSVETFLLKYLPSLNYKLTLNDTLLYKSIISTIKDEGPVVCKLHFSRIEDDSFKYLENEVNKIRSLYTLEKHPNVLVYDKIFNIQKKCILGVRQFVCHNLKEKLHRIPKLSLMEKKWLVFLLLCAVSQIHSEKMVHGDIKPSNIVLTSYSWLFLTDMVPYKPVFLGEDDLKQYNLYFGELENNLRCYIAPERFKQGDSPLLQQQFDNSQLDPAMDIFSAGCVIAEIFMDGHSLFDLAKLQNYRKKTYDPREELQKKIKDPKIVDLIMSMIHRDPYKRGSINEYILRWNKDTFPKAFHQVFFQVASTYLRPQFMFSDMKISIIRKYINSIWFTCFGKKNATVTESFNEPIEPYVFELIREDSIKEYEAYLVPSNELFVFLSKQNLQAMYESLTEDQMKTNHEDRDSIIVAVHWIGTLLTSCFYPQSRCCGLEMLYMMAIEQTNDVRLQMILPYVLQMFEDDNSKVKAKAIEVAVMMFADVLEKAQLATLSSTDYKVFDNYILPAFLKLKNESIKDQYVQHVFVKYLPLLASIGHRFLELSIGSRAQKRLLGKQMTSTIASGSQDDNKSLSVTDEQDDDSERLFSQTELLTSNVHHRASMKDVNHESIQQMQQQKEDKEKAHHHKHHDTQETFVNYDLEYDKLRRIILSYINDILSETEPTLQRILYNNLGNLSVFFGRKMTIDNLIPLSNSCFNKKDFMLRMECLKGIPYLGLTVGQQTLAKFLLITCTQLLYDTQESVVFEMINTLVKLLEFGLLSKSDSLENLEKLLPFLLHPNTWIRDATIRYIDFLADPENKILNKAQAYCIIRPKLKKYLKKGEKVFEICKGDLCPSKLKPCLSRQVYDAEITGQPLMKPGPGAQAQELTAQDKEAKLILAEVLQYARLFHQSFKRGERQQKDIEQEYDEIFRIMKQKTRLYRLAPSLVVAQIGGVSFGNAIMQPQNLGLTGGQKLSGDSYQQTLVGEDDEGEFVFVNEFRDQMGSQEYQDVNFYPVIKITENEIDRDNYGLNKRSALRNDAAFTYEVDIILQALCLVPDDQEIPLVIYKNPALFSNLAAQAISVTSLIHVEQPSAQPQQTPQFNNKSSKSLAVQVNSGSGAFYQLGAQRKGFLGWRPSGRLITTLYEHKQPVNCLAITDDSQFFITGSKLDNTINVWMTKDIESDVTSHSFFNIKCKKQVNNITTIDNSNFFAVACSQGTLDIYQMGRLEQELAISRKKTTVVNGQQRVGGTERGYAASMVVLSNEPNHCSIIKTIEKKDEGDITLCTNMILPIQQQHVLAYTTQRGSLYFHDLRARHDVSSQYELFGQQRGIATCMTIGQDPYQLYFGTVGGYVMIYDIRYNVVSSHYKHLSRAPISSIQSFNPSRSSALYNRSEWYSPMALISAGTSNYEVSLVNLATGDVEVLLTVDDRKNKESMLASLPVVPSYMREASQYADFEQAAGLGGKRFERNNSLFRRYLEANRNSQHFMSLMSLQQQQLIKNLDDEWMKHSKNRYMMVKTAIESSNACRKILVPRKYNSMLHNGETVSYAITGGNDKKLRYWDFTGLKRKSYQINTPLDDECQYHEEFQGDTLVVQERAVQYKQFPQINAQLASKQFDSGAQSNVNFNAYQNSSSTYYGILNGIMAGTDSFTGDNATGHGNMGTQSMRNQCFQIDKINDQDVAFNFNGLSEWQHFNGISMNQGCGTVGSGDPLTGQADYLLRDSQNVSHFDAITELGMIELSNQDPILITCGRDGLVKLWR